MNDHFLKPCRMSAFSHLFADMHARLWSPWMFCGASSQQPSSSFVLYLSRPGSSPKYAEFWLLELHGSFALPSSLPLPMACSSDHSMVQCFISLHKLLYLCKLWESSTCQPCQPCRWVCWRRASEWRGLALLGLLGRFLCTWFERRNWKACQDFYLGPFSLWT